MRCIRVSLLFFCSFHCWETVRCGDPGMQGGGRFEYSDLTEYMHQDSALSDVREQGQAFPRDPHLSQSHWRGVREGFDQHLLSEQTDLGSGRAPLGPRRQAVPSIPGAALEDMARKMKVGSMVELEALMRHFVACQFQLKNTYVGMPEGMPSTPELKSREVSRNEVGAIEEKMKGLLVEAEVSDMPGEALNTHLLVPFARVLQEMEEVLFAAAERKCSIAFVEALTVFTPYYREGLRYLMGKSAAAASGVMNPLRASVVRRARELDKSLSYGLRDLERLVDTYASEWGEKPLATEYSSGYDKLPYKLELPPLGDNVKFDTARASSRKKEKIFVISMLILVWVVAMGVHIKRVVVRNRRGTTAGSDTERFQDTSRSESEYDTRPSVEPTAPPFPHEALGVPSAPHLNVESSVVRGSSYYLNSTFHSSTPLFDPGSPPPSYESVMQQQSLYPRLGRDSQ